MGGQTGVDSLSLTTPKEKRRCREREKKTPGRRPEPRHEGKQLVTVTTGLEMFQLELWSHRAVRGRRR